MRRIRAQRIPSGISIQPLGFGEFGRGGFDVASEGVRGGKATAKER
jgi:hypothetical protein